jgi:diguanylate cyclase (GGDEF)-like protein
MVGGFGLYIDARARLNRTFFGLCIAIGIWAMGFSMSIDAGNMETCLFWRRISAVGWGSLYSIMLHFCLVFSRKEKALKKWWTYVLIYAPALLVVFIFAILDNTILHQYEFVKTSAGWTNVASNRAWDWFFYIYYVGYMVSGLSIIWRFGRRSDSIKIKKQVHLLLNSFLVAFLAGSATDIIGNSIFSIEIPQIAPIIILIPISSIGYLIIKHGFMNPKQELETVAILTKSTRAKVYSNLSIALAAGGLVTFIVQYQTYGDFLRPLFSSVFILMLGAVIHIIKSIKLEDNVKDIILIIIIFFSIPSITLIFLEFGSVTVWAISFIFITIAMVFNRPIVLLSVSISILSTQILIWIMKPEAELVLNQADYSGRIGILCITIWIAYYVNKIYISRLKQNSDQLSLQKLISEVSSDFINVNQSNIDEKMNWVIRILGKLFAIDRINIITMNTALHLVDTINIWNMDKKNIGEHFTQSAEAEEIDWLMEQLLSDESIFIPDVEQMSKNGAVTQRKLKERNVSSLVAIPIEEKAELIKVLEFTSVDSEKKWLDEDMKVLRIIANIFNDALLKVEAEKEISYMAYHDQLTGLPNRRLLRDRMNQAIALAKRTEKLVGIIFIDLDSFKTINDTIGHEGGDSLLKIVAEKLVNAVRLYDTVTRFGGDEFLIMINNISDEKDIIAIADKVIAILREPFTVEGQDFNLTTSVGIAMYPYDGLDKDSLIKNADIAMYKAKENGKNQYVICSSELKNEMINKIKITNNLHRALRNNEFCLNYQPQISLSEGRIIGVEALIRWNHPEMGVIPPGVFIPIAEQIGVISEIGDWVLQEACEQNKKWQDLGFAPVCMAVNVSANQLRSLNFVDKISRTLKETGLDPKMVEIEITESAAMNETGYIVDFLSKIRSLGIMIAIDDFGTDYSSLSRLKELPIDKIKIDKQFVDGIEASEKDKAIVRTIINLAKNLEIRVIAEGVESGSQLEFLKQESCDEVQGYYYYKPMPPEEIERIFMEEDARSK